MLVPDALQAAVVRDEVLPDGPDALPVQDGPPELAAVPADVAAVAPDASASVVAAAPVLGVLVRAGLQEL